MATLVFSTVGTILGGPVGGAIGSLLGQSIDQQIFGPGPREGPRLGDLAVQTSAYGTPIPQIFGKMRVAGCIIWSTDLQEDSQTQGAKGQPDTVTYSYSVSFAVALSSRPIRGIGRIWADGKLIRTAEGQFTVGTVFRIHDGSESQGVDPLIGSLEGVDQTPAYRGLALAVFEHLQLAEFGNRIPFLTFEVEADEGPVPLGLILEKASDGAIATDSPIEIAGYAAHGATAASAVERLVELYAVALFDDGRTLSSPPVETVEVAEDELGSSANSGPALRKERSQVPVRELPSSVLLSYYEPNRDYQSGLARAILDTVPMREQSIELPAVLDSSAAKALAETLLARRWAERDRLRLRLPPSHLAIRPGALVKLPQSAASWKAEQVLLDSLAMVVDLRPVHAAAASVPADPGRVLPSLGVEPAPTTVAVMELPDDGTAEPDAPVVAVAASTSGGSVGQIPLQVALAGFDYQTRSAGKAVIGTVVGVLAPAPPSAFDRKNSLEVELPGSDQWLESRDDIGMSELANLAIVGKEILQFAQAVPTGPNRFRLSNLLRGRRGTEWAIGLHSAGEAFVLLDPARLKPISISPGQVGAKVSVTPLGLGDSSPLVAELLVAGEALRPLAPAHLQARWDSSGNLLISWVRRSRRGWAWLDGVDAPLETREERYRLSIAGADFAIELETSEPRAEIIAAQLAPLGPGTAEISVVQVGDLAVSHPATATFTL